MQTLMSTFSGEPECQQDLNFFQDDNDVPKQNKKLELQNLVTVM